MFNLNKMTTILRLYNVYCTGGAQYEQVWSLTKPTICPSDGTAIAANFTTAVSGITIGNSVTTITSADSPYTAGKFTSISCDTFAGGSITIDLPDAVRNEGVIFHILKATSTNTVTIDPFGAQTISGSSTVTLTFTGEQTTIRSDGANWSDVPKDIVPEAEEGIQSLTSANNIGEGVGMFYRRIGNILEFSSLNPGSTKVTTATGPTGSVEFDVVVANLVNDAGSGSGDIWSADKVQTQINSSSLTNYSASSTTVFETTSSSDVLITDMSITPSAGKYLVMFSCTVQRTSSNATVCISIYKGGSKQDATQRCYLGVDIISLATQNIESVNGSQAIEIKIRKDGNGTAKKVYERILTLVRIGS